MLNEELYNDNFETSFIKDEISKCEDIEELKEKIFPIIKNQQDMWARRVNEIIVDNGYTKSKFAELCNVSRVAVDKWCKGAIPKNRETFLRIGMVAHYNVEKMNQLLQRYGQYPALYSKSLEDCVCIFVLNNNYGTETITKYKYILNQIKTSIIRSESTENIDNISTVKFDAKLSEVQDEDELENFITSNIAMFSFTYHKFYAYVKMNISANYQYAESVFEMAEGQGWSSSLRQCVSAIRQSKWYPTRNKIISLGLHLSMDHEQIDEMLNLAHMEPLCAKNIFESVIMFAQSLGIGDVLIQETCKVVTEAGYLGICFFGEPDYYPKHGFQTCDHFGITDWNGNNFDAFMGRELQPDAFASISGRFREAAVFEECEDREELEAFNALFPAYPQLTLSCQWLHKQRLGRISEIQKNSYTIQYWETEFAAKLCGAFYKEDREIPVVGDYVTFDYNPRGDSRIVTVCERKSLLKRPDQSGHAIGYVKTMKEQAMIANFDYIFITTSLNDNYNLNRIARYVTITLQGNGIPVVILTKADLCSDPTPFVEEIQNLSEKVQIHVVSALKGEGLAELDQYFKPGITIALLGSSGVGKSTLLNAVAGTSLMKTSEIRESDSKGRHTTTYRQLFTLENGVTIIDTPGMRELGMCDVTDGIDDTFTDISELIASCRFSDCSHQSEPGCAIKKALADGSLTEDRWELYQSLAGESKRSADMKAIAKKRKAINKDRSRR